MIYKTYKGARLDLEIYQGKTTLDYEIQVFNSNDTAFDFSVYISIDCKVFYRQHGELILTPSVSTLGNSLFLDVTVAQSSDLQLREYWIEFSGIYFDGEEELINYGILKNT